MKTILIVDDEKKIRSVYGKTFCREGFNVLKAENAEDAHDLLLKNNIDLVLLDINMPKVDGAVLYQIIEAFIPKTKVIVTSVYPLEDQKALVQGAMDYFDKSDCIRNLIEKSRAALYDFQPETPSAMMNAHSCI